MKTTSSSIPRHRGATSANGGAGALGSAAFFNDRQRKAPAPDSDSAIAVATMRS